MHSEIPIKANNARAASIDLKCVKRWKTELRMRLVARGSNHLHASTNHPNQNCLRQLLSNHSNRTLTNPRSTILRRSNPSSNLSNLLLPLSPPSALQALSSPLKPFKPFFEAFLEVLRIHLCNAQTLPLGPLGTNWSVPARIPANFPLSKQYAVSGLLAVVNVTMYSKPHVS